MSLLRQQVKVNEQMCISNWCLQNVSWLAFKQNWITWFFLLIRMCSLNCIQNATMSRTKLYQCCIQHHFDNHYVHKVCNDEMLSLVTIVLHCMLQRICSFMKRLILDSSKMSFFSVIIYFFTLFSVTNIHCHRNMVNSGYMCVFLAL